MKVITDLSQLGGGGGVRPRQKSIASRLGRRGIEVVTEFFLLFDPARAVTIPLHPLVSDLCAKHIAVDNTLDV